MRDFIGLSKSKEGAFQKVKCSQKRPKLLGVVRSWPKYFLAL